jgi:DNA-binding transcriptional LysR family regulator
MASLAKRGSCIAFQTVIGIEQELAAGTLVFIPLTDKRLPVDSLCLLARQGANGRPAAEAFLTIAREQLRRL